MSENAKLSIQIKNTIPVELMDFAASMASLSVEYSRYLSTGNSVARPGDVKLYIKEVRPGSIVTEVVALAPAVLPFLEHADTLVEYAKYLKTTYEWLAGKGKENPRLEKSTLQNLSSIIEPVVKDRGSQINFGALNFHGQTVINFSLDSLEANAVQNAARRELEAQKETTTGLHQQVLMYWAQARNHPAGAAGDKVRIESIFRGDVKVRFANDDLKTRMLYTESHPFAKAYLVDVAVETIDDRPILYKVLALHEVIDLNSTNLGSLERL